jgi:hypothetical protein
VHESRWKTFEAETLGRGGSGVAGGQVFCASELASDAGGDKRSGRVGQSRES